MISPYKILYPFLWTALLFLPCCFGPQSAIPEDQANVIRAILRENGYSVRDNEQVDDYLYFMSSADHVDLKDLYYLLLPEEHRKTLVLTDKINKLDRKAFLGVKTINFSFSDSTIDSIAVKSDSVINLGSIYATNNKIRTIPKEVSCLRLGSMNLSSNRITTLPEEIMQIFDTTYSGVIRLSHNNIDTLLLSDTLKKWISKYEYYGNDWWKFQERYQSALH